jgi:hypothetical protein
MNKHEKVECQNFFKEIFSEIRAAVKLTSRGLLRLYVNREEIIKEFTDTVLKFSKEETEESEPEKA